MRVSGGHRRHSCPRIEQRTWGTRSGYSRVVIVAGTLAAFPCAGEQLANAELSFVVSAKGDSYKVAFSGGPTIVNALAGAEVDHHWVRSSDYPHHVTARSQFRDVLGSGGEMTVTCSGLGGEPELIYSIRVYEQEPYATIHVRVRNTTLRRLSVQALRGLEAVGEDILALRGSAVADRVLSDSFSEDWPQMKIYDLGGAPAGMHRGVGSQLVYNRESQQSFFVGAL